jgi:DNA-binding transcriptional ArsR family regulator
MENELTALETYIRDWVNSKFGPDDETPNGEDVSKEFKIGAVRGSAILARLRKLGEIPPSNRIRMRSRSRRTTRHGSTFEFIQDYIEKNGWAPSQREIAEFVSGSLQTVNSDLRRLQEQGLIEIGPHARQIRIVGSVMKEAEVTM